VKQESLSGVDISINKTWGASCYVFIN